MKKQQAPFPIYHITEPDHEKVCGQGCDPIDDLAHFIRVDLTPEARKAITDARDMLYRYGDGLKIDEVNALEFADKLNAILKFAKED